MINTKELAEFIDTTNYKDLPEEVVNQAKLCFLDFLSVSLRGSQTESARLIQKVVGGFGKPGDSTIIGGEKTVPIDAALLNGVLAHSMDLDDGHRFAQLHPGSCIIPAALALSEANAKSGKDFITSLVVGYQVAITLGMVLNPSHREKGFHSTGTCGTLGAAAAAAKIIDLDMDGILNTLGLAGTQAAGLLESDHSGSMGKHLHAGKAAQSGILSALLAKEGFTGTHTIIEGEEGVIKAMSNETGIQVNDKLTPNNEKIIGTEKYEILRVYFKKYPVCRHLHSSLDATLSIITNNDIKTGDILDILVETYKIAALHNNYHPDSLEEARQSLPMSMAISIKEGNITPENISRTCQENEISEIASKVRIKLDNHLNNLYPLKRPSKVTIKCRNKTYTKRVDLANGEPETPFTKDELLNKFMELNPNVDANCLRILDDLEDTNLKDLMINLNNEFKNSK